MESNAGACLACVGVSHATAPFDLLEKVTVGEDEAVRMGGTIRAGNGIADAVVLATCNRFEVYLAGRPDGDFRAAVGAVLPDAAEFLVERRGAQAVEHLFAVTCGLDSVAVGEEQIVHQVRRAGRAAGPGLARLVDAALRTSKRVRTETAIGGAGRSLVGLGLDAARDRLGGLGGSALVIGAGTMGRLAARRLRAEGVARVHVANRGLEAARRLAAEVGGTALPLAAVPDVLGECPLVVVATRAPRLDLPAARLRRPAVLVDLGMPRSVGPEYRALDGVTVVDLEGLGHRTAGARPSDEVARARRIVAEEVARHMADRGRAVAVPLIGTLRSHAREVVEAELVRLHRRLPGLDERAREETAATIHRVVGKLLHEPTLRARELAAATDGPIYLDALSRLFGTASDEVNP